MRFSTNHRNIKLFFMTARTKVLYYVLLYHKTHVDIISNKFFFPKCVQS